MQPSANKQVVKIMKHNIKKSGEIKKHKSLSLYAHHKIRFVAVAVDEVDVFFKRGETNRTNQLLHT